MKRALLLVIAVVACLGGLYALQGRAAPKPVPRAAEPRPQPSAAEPAAEPPRASAPDEVPGQVRYIAVGGGATPEYTEVSLEQDLELAAQTLRGPGLLMFAGGSDSASVRLQRKPGKASLLARLGELFDPRGARDSEYRRTRLIAQTANLENFETNFSLVASSGREPLLVWVASHGVQGDHARDNHIELWGGEPMTVAHLDELAASATRPLRFVIASCYSGGFAELAFAHAEAADGPARSPRCGLFAGTWDRQTSGCDPNPDRRSQEGYSMHVLHALRGEDREGKQLPLHELDLDGDGKISLLEAHTRARIASHSIDVPTTTSERYLREVEHREAALNPKLLPEEHAVIARLGARLGLATKAAAEQRYKEISARLDGLEDDLDAADDELEHAQNRLSAELLARWPILSDPYHDEFASTVAKNESAISKALTESRLAQAYQSARDQVDEISARASALDPDEAEVLRLLRAYETLGLASALAARGGATYAYYQTLLACERSVP